MRVVAKFGVALVKPGPDGRLGISLSGALDGMRRLGCRTGGSFARIGLVVVFCWRVMCRSEGCLSWSLSSDGLLQKRFFERARIFSLDPR